MMSIRRRLLLTGKKPVVNINIWNEQWETGNISGGSPVPGTTSYRSKDYIPVTPGESYYFYTTRASNVYCFVYGSNKNYLGNYISVGGGRQIDIQSNCYYLLFVDRNSATYNTQISINYPATETGYHPYIQP